MSVQLNTMLASGITSGDLVGSKPDSCLNTGCNPLNDSGLSSNDDFRSIVGELYPSASPNGGESVRSTPGEGSEPGSSSRGLLSSLTGMQQELEAILNSRRSVQSLSNGSLPVEGSYLPLTGTISPLQALAQKLQSLVDKLSARDEQTESTEGGLSINQSSSHADHSKLSNAPVNIQTILNDLAELGGLYEELKFELEAAPESSGKLGELSEIVNTSLVSIQQLQELVADTKTLPGLHLSTGTSQGQLVQDEFSPVGNSSQLLNSTRSSLAPAASFRGDAASWRGMPWVQNISPANAQSDVVSQLASYQHEGKSLFTSGLGEAKGVSVFQTGSLIQNGSGASQSVEQMLVTMGQDNKPLNLSPTDHDFTTHLKSSLMGSASGSLPNFQGNTVSQHTTGSAQGTGLFRSQIGQPVLSEQWGPQFGQRLSWLVTQGIRAADIHLNPPELGPLQVRIEQSEASSRVVFAVQHSVTREALEMNMPRLRDLFADQGLTLVDVESHDMSSFTQREADSGSGGADSGDGDRSDKALSDSSNMSVEQDAIEDGQSAKVVVATFGYVDAYV